MSRLLRTVLGLYMNERLLFATGVLGLVLGGVLLIGMAFHGVIVEPEGNLYKAASFDIAVGFFLLTLALLVKIAGFTPRGEARWRTALVALAVYGYGVETIQIVRGYDPRFSRFSGSLGQLFGLSFFLSALAIMVLFLVLTTRFFFRPTTGPNGPLVLALRYGAAASMLAFFVGIAMSALGGPRVGESGNLLPLHAAGFHGLQAIPLIALLLRWAGAAEESAKKAVHLSGMAWIAACIATAWQIGNGRSVLEPSAAMAIAVALLLLWGVILARALLAFRRSGARLDFLAA